MAGLSEEQQAKALKQLEFYFSDSNLPKDRFLKGKVKEDPEGYVQLRIVIAFARMRECLKLEATTPEQVPASIIQAVAELIKQKSTSLQVDDTGTKLRRAQALENEQQVSAEVDARSLFAKPFQHNMNIDQLTEFFGKHGPVNSVRMRRFPGSKAFKGSVFVEFASVEDMEKVLGMSLEFGGAPVRMEKKIEYHKRKLEEAKAMPSNKRKHHEDDEFSNDELPDGVGGTAGGPIANNMQQSKQEAAPQDAEQEEGQKAPKRARKDEQEDEEMEGEEGEGDGEEAGGGEAEEAGGTDVAAGSKGSYHQEKGLLLGFKVEEALPQTSATRLVVDLFGGRPTVKYVELNEERTSGVIRFINAEAAKKALADFQAKAKDDQRIGPAAGELYKVEGEEEEQYMQRAKAAHDAKLHKGGGRRGGHGGRGGRGGRGRGRGRRGGRGRH